MARPQQNLAGTLSTASVMLDAEIWDAVESVPATYPSSISDGKGMSPFSLTYFVAPLAWSQPNLNQLNKK